VRLLVVDDHPPTLEFLVDYLTEDGHQVYAAATGSEALAVAGRQHLDLVVLDLSLPDLDGLAVCRRLRAVPGRPPVLVLTARGGIDDELAGFAAAADDYVRKPVDPDVLLARIAALHRRASGGAGEVVRLVGGVEVDLALREVRRAGVRQPLGPKSFDILAFLVSHPGRVWSKRQLLDQTTDGDLPDPDAVEWHVARIREALGDTGRHLRCLLTRPKVGYLVPREAVEGPDGG
jgi:DNA-binding response OmpR family regulator